MNNTTPSPKNQIPVAPAKKEAPNFYKAIFLHSDDLSKSDILVYHALGDLGGAENCAAWQEEIAGRAGISLRQTKRSLATLESEGLIIIDRSKRYRHIYHFAYPKTSADRRPQTAETEPIEKDPSPPIKIQPTREEVHPHPIDYAQGQSSSLIPSAPSEGQFFHPSALPKSHFEGTHESLRGDKKESTNTLNTYNSNKQKRKKQLTLIENKNRQNLGQLDIDPQRSLANLATLEIKPHLKQSFSTAPALIQRHTPAEILLIYDTDGKVAENLACWSDAWRAGEANLVGLKPALIWCKIVEGQAPPSFRAEEPLELPAISSHNSESLASFTGENSLDELKDAEFDAGGEGDVGGAGGTFYPRIPAPPDPLTELWECTLSILSGQMTRAAFASYLAASKLLSIEGDIYTIAASNSLTAEWIEHRLAGVVERALDAVVGTGAAELKVSVSRKSVETERSFV